MGHQTDGRCYKQQFRKGPSVIWAQFHKAAIAENTAGQMSLLSKNGGEHQSQQYTLSVTLAGNLFTC